VGIILMNSEINLFGRIVIFIVLFLLAIVSILFFSFMVINSFKTVSEYVYSPLSLPGSLNLDNYRNMISQFKIARSFLNSIIVVTGTLIIEIVICSMAAFSFAKFNFKAKNIIFMFFISLMIVPPIVLMLPLYVLFGRIGLVDKHIGIIIIYVGITCPFALYFLTNYFRKIPTEIIESAKIDGASFFTIFWKIIFPIGMPAILTLFILDYVWYWNELVLGLIFLQSNATKTMTVTAAQIGNRFFSNQPLLLTGLLLCSLPTLLIYSFTARFLMKGISIGSVKG
jgi:raffinose/stachyose/melibiose transport system permease protein